MSRTDWYLNVLLFFLLGVAPLAQGQNAAPSTPGQGQPLLILGPGDEVAIKVFDQPKLDTTTYVTDEGTLQLALGGPVHVAGLSPAGAARAIEAALRGPYLVNPQVTITIEKSSSQEVSVLGQVQRPGMFHIESNTTLLDLLAQAGGETEKGADTIFILRSDGSGTIRRLPVNLQGLTETGAAPQAAQITMRGGDQVYVPRAPEVYVMGDVHAPGQFRMMTGMTVVEALARAGGVTNMGSTRRIVIRRLGPDGKYREMSARLTDKVAPGDIVTVRERIF